MNEQALSQEPCDEDDGWIDDEYGRSIRLEQNKTEVIPPLEPCDDAISRDMALEKMADYVASGYADSVEDFEEYSKIICQLPSVTQKWETVTEFADRCRECGARYGKLLKQKTGYWILSAFQRKCSVCGVVICETDDEGDFIPNKYCPECGAKMESE